MRTSFSPTPGIGTVVGTRPGPALGFCIAHIVPGFTIGSFVVVTAMRAPFVIWNDAYL
jgi:hypothetical protein